MIALRRKERRAERSRGISRGVVIQIASTRTIGGTRDASAALDMTFFFCSLAFPLFGFCPYSGSSRFSKRSLWL